MERKSIYKLLNDLSYLGCKVICGFKSYKKGQHFYRNFEYEAITCFELLNHIGYLSENGYDEDIDNLYHIFRMYKRH